MLKIQEFSLAALFAIALSGCGMSNEEIGKNVAASMQQKFDSDPEFKSYRLKVNGIQVLKQGDKYKGMAQIAHAGENHDVPVDIAVDGSNFVWEVQPTGFGFLAQARMQNISKEVATDAVNQYQMTARQGNPIQLCVQAGLVVASYLQANDEPNYRRWQQIERADCARAGIVK